MNRLTIRLPAAPFYLLFSMLLAGCPSDPAPKNPAGQPRVEGQAVIFPAGSTQTAALLTGKVVPRHEAVLRFNGRLVWNEDRTVRIFSPLGGRVKSISASLGQTVRAGQTLATIESPDLGVAQSDARKSEQDDALAQKNLARVTELLEAGVAPAKDLQVAQADAARAAAERARTRARLKLYGNANITGAVDQRLALSAPMAGVVVERNVNPGQELRPDAQSDKGLFVISDPTRLWFVLDVAEADAAQVKVGATVKIHATLLGEQSMAGTISNVADFVDPATRTVKVRGTVENPDRVAKAEMFVTAKIRVPAATGFLVPTKAVYLRGEQSYVFVDAGGGRYVRKAVKLGPTLDGQQVVLEGVAADENVVVDGSLLLERLLASRD